MNRELLRLAIPNIISNVSVPLLSTVDTALMGHISLTHLGAIGLGSMMFNFLYWNFGFLRMGTTGLVAQAYGAKKHAEIRNLFFKSVVISVVIGVALLIAGDILFRLGVRALAVSGEMQPLVLTYFKILIWSAPATLLSFALMGWLFGMQNARLPMILTILINLINVVLSYYLVYVQDFGISGVAYGTLIAQYMGIFILVATVFKKYDFLIQKPRLKGEWLHFLNVNGDLFIRTVALTFAFGFFYRQSSAAGPVVLGANIIFLQLLNWMSYGIDGFAYAAESLVGKYYGAMDRIGLSRAIRLSFAWGLGLSLAYGLIYGMAHSSIIGLFSDDIEVLRLLDNYRLWIALIPLGAFACYIWDGIFIGLTASAAMRDAMLISLVVYLATFLALQYGHPNAIWISLTIFLIIRGALQYAWWLIKIKGLILNE